MKTYITCLSMILLLSSCVVKIATPKAVTGITMRLLNADTLAIRALEYEDGTYWFAGTTGQYGTVTATNNRFVINKLPDIASKMEFRSIAVTTSYTYIMSAGSPALCYRIDKKSGEVRELYRNMDEHVFYDSMKFWNDREGIILGDPVDNCFNILKTTDAGASFTTITCNALPDFVEGEAAFAASNSNIVVKDNEVWFATGGKRARVFYSSNRGTSWTVTDTPILAGGAMTGIFAMDFYDNKQGVVIGGNWEDKEDTSANKAQTLDGGRTWQLMNINENPAYCSDILYVPGTEGKELLAVGSEGVWWSGDTGNSWNMLTDRGFYTAAMQDDSHGVLAGRQEVVRFTLLRK
jgi:photosystem II stability/assembly factor-like uncharacterized protein